ncbi:MAG: HNH endonuclease signature motif containing protein [Candidatus Micrarchaeota archaeon]|nr:HNH endonuclease signature motif containing protein [Candidatus Micrarchaeota archaeon]
MSNDWGIPDWLEQKVRKRDTRCVYCHKIFNNSSKDRATWEHVDNNSKNITESNIALCCASCNSSKSAKSLEAWLKSDYCKNRGITKSSISI